MPTSDPDPSTPTAPDEAGDMLADVVARCRLVIAQEALTRAHSRARAAVAICSASAGRPRRPDEIENLARDVAVWLDVDIAEVPVTAGRAGDPALRGGQPPHDPVS